MTAKINKKDQILKKEKRIIQHAELSVWTQKGNRLLHLQGTNSPQLETNLLTATSTKLAFLLRARLHFSLVSRAHKL